MLGKVCPLLVSMSSLVEQPMVSRRVPALMERAHMDVNAHLEVYQTLKESPKREFRASHRKLR